MEKIYMEAPKNTRMWRPEDISPYDMKDDLSLNRENYESARKNRNELTNRNESIERRNQNRNMSSMDNQHDYDFSEDSFDMDALMEDMDRLEEEMNEDDMDENDMYENGNIDWQCNEDVSRRSYKNQTMERKTIVEEDNPKRTTTTWMRVTRQY